MNEPRRLLTDLDALGPNGDFARGLLEAGRDVAPPPGQEPLIWARIEAMTATPGGAGSSPQASEVAVTAGAGPGTTVATKLGIAGILAGAGLVAATLLRQPTAELNDNTFETDMVEIDSPGIETATPARAALAQPESPAPADARTAAPVTAERAPRLAEAPPDAAEERAKNRLRESTGVNKVRSLLGSGDAQGALAELAAIDRDVENGALGQERHLLRIQALAAAGRRAEASKLARAFIDANPNTPYAKRLQPYL